MSRKLPLLHFRKDSRLHTQNAVDEQMLMTVVSRQVERISCSLARKLFPLESDQEGLSLGTGSISEFLREIEKTRRYEKHRTTLTSDSAGAPTSLALDGDLRSAALHSNRERGKLKDLPTNG